MREGVTEFGVVWASKEFPDLDEHPLNLLLYIHLRIFVYLSKIHVTSFEQMDTLLSSGTWKNLWFFLRSCSFN